MCRSQHKQDTSLESLHPPLPYRQHWLHMRVTFTVNEIECILCSSIESQSDRNSNYWCISKWHKLCKLQGASAQMFVCQGSQLEVEHDTHSGSHQIPKTEFSRKKKQGTQKQEVKTNSPLPVAIVDWKYQRKHMCTHYMFVFSFLLLFMFGLLRPKNNH